MNGDVTASRLLDALDPCRIFARSGLTPDPWQAKVLRLRPKRALICWGRQTGKTYTFSALALSQAFWRPGTLTLVTAFNQDKSKALVEKAMTLYKPFKEEFPLMVDSTERKVFRNGSAIQALPGLAESSRGPTAHLVLMDEAAWTTTRLKAIISQTLATTDGPLVAMSTPPEEPMGWWWSAWTSGGIFGGEDAIEGARGDGWYRSFVPSTRCPRISPEFLERTQVEDGELAYQRECLCEFPQPGEFTSNQPISPAVVQAVDIVPPDAFFGAR